MTRALAVVAALLAGTWVLGAVVAPGRWSAIVLILALFLVVGRLARHDRAARTTVRVCAVVAVAALAWSSRPTTVDEDVVVGAPAPAGVTDDLLGPQP